MLRSAVKASVKGSAEEEPTEHTAVTQRAHAQSSLGLSGVRDPVCAFFPLQRSGYLSVFSSGASESPRTSHYNTDHIGPRSTSVRVW